MSTNLAGLVLRHAQQRPDHVALTIPRDWDDERITAVDSMTYGELAERVARYRGGLHQAGFVEHDRVVVMFPVSVDLYAFVLAMLASGLVAVFVDLGMGKKRVLQAVQLSRARAIVSVDPLMKWWPIIRALWGRKRYAVDRARIGVRTLDSLLGLASDAPVLERSQGTSALMTFTSGSTGAPRAANRTHDILIAQHHALSEEFPAGDDEVDMPCFPVVPLHNLCCGITTVMPAVDLRAPATVNPSLILDQVADCGVTRMTGAPAYLTRIADELERRGHGLETVKRLGCGGAPTPIELCRRLVAAMPQADLLVIYGSTEAEPMTSVMMQEVVDAEGEGYLVGTTAEAATVEVVELPDPPPALDEREMAPFRAQPGEVGEVVVRGPHVLRGYVDDPAADAATKLPAPDGGVWHRTYDLGTRDELGRLWLVGRVPDVIYIPGSDNAYAHPYPVEAAVEQWPEVQRCALIAYPARAELLIEAAPGEASDDVVRRARAWLDERDLSFVHVDLMDEIPMDPRHNSKVARPVLREMRGRLHPPPKLR